MAETRVAPSDEPTELAASATSRPQPHEAASIGIDADEASDTAREARHIAPDEVSSRSGSIEPPAVPDTPAGSATGSAADTGAGSADAADFEVEEPSGRGVWLLTFAALLAIAAGVLGGLWLNERSTNSELRSQLDAPVDTVAPAPTGDAEVERLEDLVRTLELRNAELDEELEALRPLVADVPEGRIGELSVPFSPVFVDESSGRFIAVSATGEYVVIDGTEGEILDAGQANAAPVGLVALRDVAWVATESGLIEVVSMVGAEDGTSIVAGPTRALTRNDRAMWAWSVDTGELRRHRITNGRVTANVSLPSPPIELAGGAGAIWTLGEDGLVYQVNTADFTVTAVEAGQDVVAITAGPDALWALSAADGSLRRIDPVSGQVLVTVPVGRDPIDAVVSGNSVWVALRSGSTTLIEVDTRTSAVVSRTALPGTPASITDGETGVIVTLEGDENPLIRVASVDAAADDAVEDAG